MDVAHPDPEASAVARLTAGIEPAAYQDILVRCLSGRLSPAVALMQLLIESEDAAVVRSAIDEVTRRAAALSRASDSLLRDRVDDLTQLVVENEPGCEKKKQASHSTLSATVSFSSGQRAKSSRSSSSGTSSRKSAWCSISAAA
jgi:hypothetical protein